MAKVRTRYDISPAGTFGGHYVTRITTENGDRYDGRGHTREESREAAEDKYDHDRRDE